MKKNPALRRALVILAVLLVIAVAALVVIKFTSGPKYPETIENPGFETSRSDGKWEGWIKKDAAFGARGIVSDEKLNGAPMEKAGNNYYSGVKGGNQAMRGTLTSTPFTLGGTGFVSFKMGAGLAHDKVYVEFFQEGKDGAIAKVANTDCDGIFITDHLITKVVDLSAYKGKAIYIVVTDNDDGSNLAYVNLDDFRVLQTQAEIDAANADHARQIAEFGEKPFTEDETSTDIVNGSFETGDLTGWKTLEGTALSRAGIVPTSQRYWTDRSVYGDGEFYLDGSNNGAILESATGAIRSTKFTLAGDGFITFMIGAGPKDCYVALCDGKTDEELIKITNTSFSDPALALTLLRVYVDASEHLGKVVYLKVVDANDTSGFAFMNVDDFRVSLTRDQVADLEVEQLEKIQAETYNSATYDDLTSLRNYYTTYAYPVPLKSLTMTAYAKNQVVDCGTADLTAYLADASASYGSETVKDMAIVSVTLDGETLTGDYAAFDLSKPGAYKVRYAASYNGKTVEAGFTVIAMADHQSVANGGFESGDLAGWTVLNENWAIVEGQAAGVISAADYWGEKLPYNQAGAYHLDGWNNGIGEPETWQVKSTSFTLGGSGFISVRMGGHAAAVRVYLTDGAEIGYFKQTRFADQNFPSLAAGGSWADMGTYVMDLSAHLGKEMYIVLCDEDVPGWSHGFFDEVVTYYESAPAVADLFDTVPDGVTAEEVRIPWQLAENLVK